MKKLRRKGAWRNLALLVVAVCLAVQGMAWLGWLEGPENIYYDLWYQMVGRKYQPERVVIVALDDETLRAHPGEPLVCWTPHFARVLEVLRRAGAAVIGLDYIFSVSIESWLKKLDLPQNHKALNYDAPFRKELASRQVVMAGSLVSEENQKSKIILPLQDYFCCLPGGANDVGLLNFYTDADGVVRRYVPALKDSDGLVLLTFAKLLALRAERQDPALELRRLINDPALSDWSADDLSPRRRAAFPVIGFVGPPNTFPRLSFQRFLSPAAESDPKIQNLRGKVVILAYEPGGLQDIHYTPFSQGWWLWPGSDMSGPELHANIIETLLTGRFPRPVAGHLGFLYLLAITAGGSVLFYRLPSWPGLAALGSICLLAALAAFWLFERYWLLPTAAVQLGAILSFTGILGIRLAGEEQERARIRKIFGRYVADEVVEKLLASGKLPDLGGEVVRVTVLFSDIRNFTTISEKLDPRQTVEMLNSYLGGAVETILREGGTLDKFIGDAVMAVFGSPEPDPDHARRAIRAALGLAQKAEEFRGWMSARFGDHELPEFEIGVGLHTGEAIVGNIGSPKRLEFTAIGDTVNAASRLESLTKELGWTIVASQSTVQAAPGVVTGREEIRAVKGRKEILKVFEVLDLE